MLHATIFVLSLVNVPIGQLPPGWVAAKTGRRPRQRVEGGRGRHRPSGRKALAQTSAEGPKRLFNLCVAKKTSFRDLDLSVAFKAVAGKIDRGGGLVWRYIDAKNYYVARMNPLENNYRVYKVVAGKRTQLATADTENRRRQVAHPASHPRRQTHPMLFRRQAISRRQGRHVSEGRQNRSLDQGRRTDAFCQFPGR